MNYDIEIRDEAPFENDMLNREKEIRNLTSILKAINTPFVLAVDAPWGMGKTTFIKIWKSFLKLEKMESICFNAWETDFASDPLIPIVNELNKWISEKSKGSKFISKINPMLSILLKRGVVAAAKLATFSALELDKEYEKVASEMTGKSTEDFIANFKNQLDTQDQFKKLIKKEFELEDNNSKRVFVFIDELDRCRPTYAIELLERIKHLFNIEGLIFVLSTDLNQLSHSVCAVYGHNFEARKYLERFIDLEYSLESPYLPLIFIDRSEPKYQIEDYLDRIFDSEKISDLLFERGEKNVLDIFKKCSVFLSNRFKLDLRKIQKLFFRVKLILAPFPYKEDKSLRSILILALLFIKENNQDLFQKYESDSENIETIKDVISFLGENFSFTDKNNFSFACIEGELIRHASNKRNYLEKIEEKLKTLESSDAHSSNDESCYLSWVSNVASRPLEYTQISISSIISQIKLLDNFRIKDGIN